MHCWLRYAFKISFLMSCQSKARQMSFSYLGFVPRFLLKICDLSKGCSLIRPLDFITGKFLGSQIKNIYCRNHDTTQGIIFTPFPSHFHGSKPITRKEFQGYLVQMCSKYITCEMSRKTFQLANIRLPPSEVLKKWCTKFSLSLRAILIDNNRVGPHNI